MFLNVGYGIRAGMNGFMDAEMTVSRCRFTNVASAGISIESWNALDFYIRNCTPGAWFHLFVSRL